MSLLLVVNSLAQFALNNQKRLKNVITTIDDLEN